MENKKLIKILLKDMCELEELICEVKSNGKFEPLEMEFIHTRAKGVLQLLNLFDSREGKAPEDMRQYIGEEKLNGKRGRFENNGQAGEDDRSEIKSGVEKPEEEPSQKPAGEIVDEPSKRKTELHSGEDDKKVKQEEEEGENDMLEEEPGEPEANSRLGESFLKGKSVNDLITDQHKLEFKLSNRPVSSIKAAIGINDRFQYIRELFDNSTEKFTDAVETLDSMKNIKEAVDYLRKNFKWKKSESSLKFVNLVKRRFQGSTEN